MLNSSATNLVRVVRGNSTPVAKTAMQILGYLDIVALVNTYPPLTQPLQGNRQHNKSKKMMLTNILNYENSLISSILRTN
jgi:hypothetical protein